MATPITAALMRDLLASGAMNPTLVRWDDTDELAIVPGVLFSDISYADRARPHTAIVTQAEIQQGALGDYDPDNPTDDDYAAMADMLNSGA